MNKKQKILEAEYFFKKMRDVSNNPTYFHFELSAFLSAARSPLQYALEEVKGTGNQGWYDQKISNSEVLTFFKDKRDFNVHAEPVQSDPFIDIQAFDPICVSISEGVELHMPDGSVSQKGHTLASPSTSVSRPAKLVRGWRFNDWIGDGGKDVFLLCEKYLNEIKAFIEDGIRKKYLSND